MIIVREVDVMKKINSYIIHHISVLYLFSLICFFYKSAVAKESMPTPAVVGHKPTVTNVSLNKKDLVFGDTASLNYSYHDIDGDPEDRPKMVRWSYGYSTASGDSTILIKNTDKDCKMTYKGIVSVIPTSKSGEPLTGDPVSIPISVNNATPINGFEIHPDSWSSDVKNRVLNWPDADKYCRSIGKKLPTVRQAQDFISHYNKRVNNGVPKILGWPSYDYRPICGGVDEAYWTSDVAGNINPGHYKVVSINSGHIDNAVI